MKLLILSLFLLSCVSAPKPQNLPATEAYSKARQFTEKMQLEPALTAWEQFIKVYPTTDLSASAFYFKGYTHEHLGQYQSAVNSYRSAITMWGVKNPSDRAQALLRISSVYEAMGENAKSLATLRELEKTKSILNTSQKEIEIPARKALLYAKEGNQQEAKLYYTVATKNMNQYLRRNKAEQNEWLAEVLYRLSETDPSLSLPDFKAALDSLAINQSYLAKVIEMEINYWPGKAIERLEFQYTNLYNYILNYVKASDLMQKREQEEAQKELAASLIDSLEQLPQEFLPNSKDFEEKVENFQKQMKANLQAILLRRNSGEGLTNEAQKRQGIRRGKDVEAPLPSLPKLPAKDPNL